MNMQGHLEPPHILLIEPNNLIRGTLAAVCRDMGLAQLHQATSVATATDGLDRCDLQGIVVALDSDGIALNLLREIRAGKFACDANLGLAVMSPGCTVELAIALRALDVKRILLQPFKLRDAILMLEQLGARLASEAPPTPSVESTTDSEADEAPHSEDEVVREDTKIGSAPEAQTS
jgi:hypothetical protein